MTERRGQGERNLILIVSHSRRSSGSTVQASLPSHEKESGELLVPVVAAMKRELTSGSYIQADEPRSMCRHARARERITKRISGNMVAPEGLWCSTSV